MKFRFPIVIIDEDFRSENSSRITSYNVCYTKLLRREGSISGLSSMRSMHQENWRLGAPERRVDARAPDALRDPLEPGVEVEELLSYNFV